MVVGREWAVVLEVKRLSRPPRTIPRLGEWEAGRDRPSSRPNATLLASQPLQRAEPVLGMWAGEGRGSGGSLLL